MAETPTQKSLPGSLVSTQNQLEAYDPNSPFTFINTFILPSPDVEEAFLESWANVARFMKTQHGLISAQLYRGCPDKDNRNNIFTMVVVWESVLAYREMLQNPELLKVHRGFPEGTEEFYVMATKVAVPGVCTA